MCAGKTYLEGRDHVCACRELGGHSHVGAQARNGVCRGERGCVSLSVHGLVEEESEAELDQAFPCTCPRYGYRSVKSQKALCGQLLLHDRWYEAYCSNERYVLSDSPSEIIISKLFTTM